MVAINWMSDMMKCKIIFINKMSDNLLDCIRRIK